MIAHLLNAELQVWRRTSSTDPGGGQDTTWVPLGACPVRISQPTGAEIVRAAQDLARLTHQVYTTPGRDLDRGDELRGVHHSRPIVLRVLNVMAPSEPAYLRADCEERQAEGED